ncbi:MAG: type I restriction endonuclease subunit R [Archangium gephyra]|uniref:Type I restriction endonuclease subunit R n=1 Tax=Archangium gephyra TaxID=48 RepID=A0A2W5VA93_9BACT|nr:MAG: type I restriction endonuclease subunit R [Archangium gephyra]
MSLHREVNFEVELCAHLTSHGWLSDEGDAQRYDRSRALFGPDVVAWVQATQPKAWEALSKQNGSRTEAVLLDRLRAQLDQRGVLDVLRNGIELMGLRESLKMAQFKPATGLNDELLKRYEANRLRVVRQVRYSQHNENSIDVVLFLNGLAVATAELKTDFTQSVGDAVDQYRIDRQPKTRSHSEPLLSFPGGAPVHFAVSNSEVQMTTRLAGDETTFLPFNQGNEGGAGNPINSDAGYRTAYLWERVWERSSWLEILGRYLITKRDAKKQPVRFIFPRYHQLDVTRKLVAAVLADGPGTRYLVQHSAGSGKTNSIAWTAHFLSELHDAQDKKVFDSVLVISDRTVIDDQLQEAVFDFERTTGVVATITGESASKSGELTKALSEGKKIVVCTLQTFPFALKAVRELSATKGKRFAVIADEAHSSQAGQAAADLKRVLTVDEQQNLKDGGEVSTEDIMLADMEARASDRGITFVAFTATPKNKTLELFGTRPDPSRKPAPDNVPQPFHVYSMRQAIEEKFILDVLQNYLPYSMVFRLKQEGGEAEDREVERDAAMKKLMGWVRLHPVNIAKKVELVVEHFRTQVAPLLGGKAKAMVVVSSRVEAVRWKLAIEKFIKEKRYPIGALVAFSGDVEDVDSGPQAFSEGSQVMNPNLRGRSVRDAFDTGDFQILLVANKFQTGFDQPLLCGMYVDKRLDGIQAVQTLSRLNRAHPGKDTTYIVDFVNDPEAVLASFKTYYETAELVTTTDPNLVYDLRAKLDASGYYDDYEVDRVAFVVHDPKSKHGDLLKAVEPTVDRLMRDFRDAKQALLAAKAKSDEVGEKEAQEKLDALALFKADMQSYVRLYAFLSQIFDFGSTEIEGRSFFYKSVLPHLEFGRERETIDLSKVKLSHYGLKPRGVALMLLPEGENPKLAPVSEAGSGKVQEKEKAQLIAIIEKLNQLFEGVGEQDELLYVDVVKAKLLESQTLIEQATNNLKEQFAASPDLETGLMDALMAALDAHTTMSTQAIGSKEVRAGLKDILLNHVGLWEALRAKSG